MNSVKIVNFYACLVILTILCEGIATPVCVEKDVDEFKTFMQNYMQTNEINFIGLINMSLNRTANLQPNACFMARNFCYPNDLSLEAMYSRTLRDVPTIDNNIISLINWNFRGQSRSPDSILMYYIQNIPLRICRINCSFTLNMFCKRDRVFFVSLFDPTTMFVLSYRHISLRNERNEVEGSFTMKILTMPQATED